MSNKMNEAGFSYNSNTLEGIGWEEEARIGREMHEINPTLSAQTYRTLLNAIATGLPMVIKYHTHSSEYNKYYTKSAMIPTYISVWKPEGNSSLIRVKYWGFCHSIYLNDIVEIETAHAEYLDEPIEEDN